MPLLCEIGFRWFGHHATYESAENIPELTFVVGVLCLSAASDVSSVAEVVNEDKEAAGILDYQYTLYLGAFLGAMLFGGYTAISSYHEVVEAWRPHMVLVAWLEAALFSIIAIKAERVALKVITGP